MTPLPTSAPARPAAAVPAGTASLVQEDDEEAAAGPFDNVISTIETIIENLRQEGNSDMDRKQFCADSQAQNLNEWMAAKAALDTLKSGSRMAETAIAELDTQTEYFKAERTILMKKLAELNADFKNEE